jgi:dolichyl-phosphate beta-glucosyltransferase
MPDSPFLSIVIPAYHEAGRLPATLDALAAFCGGLEFPWEVWIVVEHGRDETLEIAAAFAARQAHFQVISNPVHRGKGYAVRTGMLRARGDVIFYMDADLSVPLREVTASSRIWTRTRRTTS